jgi:hypothetical protein
MLPLTPGDKPAIVLQGLPVGDVSFLGEAFATPCAAVQVDSRPSYISDVIDAFLDVTSRTPLKMLLKVNGEADLSVGFEDVPFCKSDASCSDADSCTLDTCDKGKCLHTPIAFDDGNVCTIDTCDPTGGIAHVPVDPNDGNACTQDICDPALGVVNSWIDVDDFNVCTVDSCDLVAGPIHSPVSVEDFDPCTTDSCDPTFGVQHQFVNVDDGNSCTADSCDPFTGAINHTPVVVDDNDVCTVDACEAGGVTHTPLTCDDGNPATFDSCSPVFGCVFSACTSYFSDTFADNSQGWTLGTEWNIGAATPSSGHNYGNPDPSVDHSGSADNGVAGVVIGGNASTSLHSFAYLESPAVDLSVVSGAVNLQFWRWLNSDYVPYMTNSVEVFDGFTWVTLWLSEGSPGVTDFGWTPQSFDVTAFKNSQFRVRFGFNVGSSSVYSVSSWNIDDVRLVDAGCSAQ